jgi:hypothetical protein
MAKSGQLDVLHVPWGKRQTLVQLGVKIGHATLLILAQNLM